jgi:hypothetical protein
MHDCRKTKEDLIDLVFNEVEATHELRILEELETCRACGDEYRSMNEALNNFDEAAASLMPGREFWADYHAALESRVEEVAGARVIPFWRRAFQTSFSIPAPVGIAAALLLVATSFVALRSLILAPRPSAPISAGEAKVQFVEVPVEKRVVEEKVVTRTVYVTKRVGGRSSQPAPSVQDIPDITAQNAKDATASPARPALNGFQPPNDVKLTFIKGSFNDGK